MISSNLDLLANEAALMQGCFKFSLTAIQTGSSAERGPFYVAFFNYGIGLERLLKLILLLDHWHRHGTFPENSQLKQYGGKSGHNVEKLYGAVKSLFAQYSVEWRGDYEPDEINRRLLSFLSDFANGSRYFNLDTLTGDSTAANPLGVWEGLLRSVYEVDVHPSKRESTQDEVNAVVEMTESHTVYMPATSLGGEVQSYAEFCQDHGKMRLVLPEICWRLVKILVPLKELLLVIRERVHEKEFGNTEESIPYMEEFLDFVCDDKKAILESQDWPYTSPA